MTNRTRIIFAFGIIGLMVLMVWFFSGGGSSSGGGNQPGGKYVSAKWDETYVVDSKKPQGLYLFNKVLKAHLDTNQKISVIDNLIHFDSITKTEEPKTYLFIGKRFGLKYRQIDTLLARIEEGSTIFLAYEYVSENLNYRLFNDVTYLHDYASYVDLKGNNNNHRLRNIYQNDTIATKWWGFNSYELDSSMNSQELSNFKKIPNFLSIKNNDGKILLNTTPKAFVNYQMKRKDGFKYASFVVEQLPKNQSVYVLELGRMPEPKEETYEDLMNEEEAGKRDDSYWKEIFKEPSLTKALVFSLLMTVLFLIFRSRRRRPVVEHLEKKKDMSRAFAETISSIYFSKRNPAGLLQVQKKNFYDTVQRHFFIDLAKRDGDKAVKSLAEKSNVEIKEIETLLSDLETAKVYSLSDEKLAEIAQKQQKFYLDAGIISEKTIDNIESKELTLRRALLIPSILILTGITLFFLGMYMIIQSNGLGIIFWPISVVILILGIIRLNNPLAKFNNEHITFYTIFGTKKKFLWENLHTVEPKETGVILWFEDNKKLILNNWDMSRYDRKIFQQLIEKLNTLKV